MTERDSSRAIFHYVACACLLPLAGAWAAGAMVGRLSRSFFCPWFDALVSHLRLRFWNRSRAEDLQMLAQAAGIPVAIAPREDARLVYAVAWMGGSCPGRSAAGFFLDRGSFPAQLELRDLTFFKDFQVHWHVFQNLGLSRESMPRASRA